MGSIVYFAQRADGDIKIGWTDNVHNRIPALRSKHGALNLLGVIDGGRDVEKALHTRFAEYRRPTGKHNGLLAIYNEWFSPAKALTDFIEAEARPLSLKRQTSMAVLNRVPELVAEKFGGKDKINLTHVQAETKLNYATVSKWVKGKHEQRIDLDALETWCKYLGVGVGDILVYVPDKE